MPNTEMHVGAPRSRVDGPAKVTGTAPYAGEFAAPDLLYGVVVSSAIARGRITRLATEAALGVPGVVTVFSHDHKRRTAWRTAAYQDMVAPPGTPFRPLQSDLVQFSGQPIALVVAESFEAARYAASLIEADYAAEAPQTDLTQVRATAYDPPKKRSGIKPPPKPRGDAEAAFAAAPVRIAADYRVAIEHHNPMEPHATTVVWEGGGRLTIHDKIQGVGNSAAYVTGVFGLAKDQVHVVSPFVGGAFGSGLRPQYQLFLAVLAALELERSVRVVLTRDQMFTFGYRPDTIQHVALGAAPDGRLQAVLHEAVAGTSRFEDYQEVVVNWSGMLYACDNVRLTYRLAQLDTYTPADMRAPGAVLGVFALETAMDELAVALKLDPIELRLRNYSEQDANENKRFTSKALRRCYAEGAARFGWSARNPEPGAMREGRERVGWGMATGVWDAQMMKTSARALLTPDGRLEIASATADIGTGTYTILTQIAADALGLPLEAVTVRIGDSALPQAPIEGGSWTAASAGSAVQQACRSLADQLFRTARRLEGSPFANADFDHIDFTQGRMALRTDPARSLAYGDILRAAGLDRLAATETVSPSVFNAMRHVGYTHSAIFAEVKVDETLGVVRVTRIVSAVAAGRILNPKTARSQILGGIVMGLGAALHEESMLDHTLGRFMNHNFAEYHVPVHADIGDIEVIFVEEEDAIVSPIGAKGLGEIGIVGTAAAIGNAVFHATGKRLRHLPITLDALL